MIVEPLLKFYSRTMLLMKMGRAGDMGTCEGFATVEFVIGGLHKLNLSVSAFALSPK